MSHDRDRILEQALKHELRVTPPPYEAPALRSFSEEGPALRSFSEGGCLDAETLAAWEDGGLDAVSMELAEVHLSTCSRCQSLAGTMARAIPVMAPLKSDEPFRLWKWWLAPIAAATAAVTIWMVVPAEREAAVAPPIAPARDAAVAQVEPKANAIPEASAPAEAPVATEKRKDQLADRMEQSADAPAAPQKPIDVTLGRVQQRADAPAPAAQPEDRRKREENLEAKKEDADASKLMRENAVAAAETAAAAARPPATAAAPPAAPAPAPAAPRDATLQKRAFAPTPVEVVSPDSRRRWRFVASALEYSTDAGATWVPVRPATNEIVTGGVAVSGSICWLIGRSGLVLVTVDGMTFARVDLPERVDVATIAATDARSATVKTADGRTFRTDDSGRTWRRN